MKKVFSVFFACLLVLGAAGTGWAAITNVYDLFTAIAGDTGDNIVIDTITLFDGPGISNDIEISHDVTISGGTINANKFPIFRITEGANVTFEGVTFENAAGTAAAIRVEKGTATFNGGTFRNNASGAVTIEANAEASFTGVMFQDNIGKCAVTIAPNAEKVEFSGGRFQNNSAGAVTTAGKEVSFSNNVLFTDNKAANGGAVKITGGEVTFDGGTFRENEATGSGGALYLEILPTFRGILNFDNNSADKGGAIFAETLTLTLDNKFIFDGNFAGTNGGAVLARTLNVTEGNYSGNTAGGTGGALYGITSVIVSGGAFNNNGKAGGIGVATTTNGGAIGSAGAIDVSGGTFSGNEAKSNGGAISSLGAVNVSGGTFSGNEAKSNGGAVYTTASSTVSGGTFRNNIAGGSGGAFYGGATVTVTGGEFTTNKSLSKAANTGGGAIYSTGDISITPSAASMTLNAHEAGANGGALYSGGAVTAERVIFTQNKAGSEMDGPNALAGSGGAIYSGGKSTLLNCVFGEENQGNSAAKAGGAIYAEKVQAIKTTFHANKAGTTGGAISLSGAGAATESNIIENCLFERNRATSDGGAVYFAGTLQTIEFSMSIFDANYSGTMGGAAALHGAKVLFSRCTFEGNNIEPGVQAKGGAVFSDARQKRFVNCTFFGNKAGSGEGGALYIAKGNDESSSEPSVIFYCTFVGNEASGRWGGALYTAAEFLDIAASVFVSNYATYGRDTFRNSGVITSRGYNIVGNHDMTGSSGNPTGEISWRDDQNITQARGSELDPYGSQYTSSVLFGDNKLADNGASSNVGAELKARRALQTLALIDSTASAINPALDFIPGQTALDLFGRYFGGAHIDERGEPRPNTSDGKSDAGAYESEYGGSGGGEDGAGVIAYVKMSEIPNTMVKVGQTCSLTALVYYRDGTFSSSELVTWATTVPNYPNRSSDVAHIDRYGNLVSLKSGTAIISVTTQRQGFDGKKKTDTHELEVSEEWEWSDNNIDPDVWGRLGTFNSSIESHAEQLFFLDVDPAVMEKDPFVSAFKSAYGVAPAQVKNISGGINFKSDSASLYSGTYGTPLKPSISVTLSSITLNGASSASGGGVLPVRVVYSLSWDEVGELLGRDDVTKIDNPKELFGKLNLAFTDRSGNESVLADNGKEGIDASGKAFAALTNGNNGLTLTFDVLLSDANGKPQVIDKYLTAADGVADGSIAGSLWLLKSKSGGDPGKNEDEGEGGGGGGCDAGFGLFALFVGLGALLFTRRIITE